MLPPEVSRVVQLAAQVIGDTTSDFPAVKGYFVNFLAPKTRSLFQRRHRTTRKHLPPNEVEKEVIELWKKLTGVELSIPPGKRHPETWVQRPHGWNISSLNTIRWAKREHTNEDHV